MSYEELLVLVEWIKRKEERADQKYWEEVGLTGNVLQAQNLPLTEKNSIIDSKR